MMTLMRPTAWFSPVHSGRTLKAHCDEGGSMAETTADIEAAGMPGVPGGDVIAVDDPGTGCMAEVCSRDLAVEGADSAQTALGADGGSVNVPEAVVACEPSEEDEDEARARAAAEAAERELHRAQETAQRKERAAQVAAERAATAVEAIGSGAGFMTSYGAYYDVKAAKNAADSAAEARAKAEALAAARDGRATGGDGPGAPDEGVSVSAADCADGSYVDEDTFRCQVARLTESVARQPLHREIYYKTLVFCEEARPLRDIEGEIATFAEFKGAANSQYHFIEVLEQAGGLERFELDEEGEVVTPERKEGLTEDEVDDLVWDYAFMTTPAGLAVVEQHAPRARIIELLDLVPERKDAYIELLEFCSEEPRAYNEIRQLFVGRDVLVRLVNGEPQTMQPSVFVDKLEAAGAVEWRDGWVLTGEGRSYLQELREL